MNVLNSDFDLSSKVKFNTSNIKLRLLFIPVLLLIDIFLFLLNSDCLTVNGYVDIQKDSFLYLNTSLSKLPHIQNNLTQLGDIHVSFSLLAIFIVYAPKLWEILITSSLLSLIVSSMLKKIFAVPRPAAVFENESFTIIGTTLKGYSSLPSGHSIATFVVVTTVLFAFQSSSNQYKRIFRQAAILTIGLCIAFTRVGVGAHYPLDVIIGSILGYMITVVGISINNYRNVWNWIHNPKCLIIFILLFFVSSIVIINKIIIENLFIHYVTLSSLIFSMYVTIKAYAKKRFNRNVLQLKRII